MSAAAERIRVVLADDSSFVRRAFNRVLSNQPDIDVVGEAADGAAAFELCQRLAPDVMLLDLQMPVRDGISTLEGLKHLRCPTRVVIVSASSQPGAEVTLNALEKGAFDFVDKGAVGSSMQLHELGDELLAKVRSAGRRPLGEGVVPTLPEVEGLTTLPEVLLAAASTGGPMALAALLAGLPRDFDPPVVLIQHIPTSYAEALVARLSRAATRPARLVLPGQLLERGTVYLASGDHEAELFRCEGKLAVVWRRPDGSTPHVPSADALFTSAARVCGDAAWAVQLTGMGRDGAAGLLELHKKGALTLAQDEQTSAVWGMPGAACAVGAVRAVLPLYAIGPFVGEQYRKVVQQRSAQRTQRKEAP